MDENHMDQLSIFEPPPMDTTIQTREWVEFRPINQISEYSAVEFNIPPLSTGYMDLKNSRLKIKIRILNKSNSPVSEEDPVALSNLPLHTIFSQVDTSLQQTPVSQLGTNYPYKAYIDTLLSTSAENYDVRFSQLFFKDTSDPDDADPIKGVNIGLFQRYQYTKSGKLVDLEGPLHVDVFEQQRLILNGVALSLKLWPSKDPFRLMCASGGDYKIQIVDVSFKLCIQRHNPALIMAHLKMFEKSPAIYPYLSSNLKIASITKGEFAFTMDDVFQGEVPSTLVVGLVSSSAFSGDYKKSPYNFQHFDCNFVGFYVDGQSFPSKPLQPNYDTQTYLEAYQTLVEGRETIHVEREDYIYGNALYVLNINPYIDFNTKRKGHCRLELKFAVPLPESVTVILNAKFPQVLLIDQSRSIIFK
ncbi:uncharacterized protein F54H12.2-like [Saccostrea echinata]|uniref:uncharacterized protein F54H12.2-like n=1 Tax=Saccostrea echinata TaxID=191078 RepID=UPI002A8359CD|nr:uncharacterized protein F54H12.2-like [Saccostrea echinata]